MTLRLSSGSSLSLSSLSSSTTATSIDTYLQKITDDTSISQAQKNDCLKTLGIVLKNLIDPAKGGASGDAGLKYRTLKLDNPKIRARLFCSSSQIEGCVRDLLTDASLVGMSETPTAEGNRFVLEAAPAASKVDVLSLRLLPAITTAQARVAATLTLGGDNSQQQHQQKHQQQQQQQQQHQHPKKARLTEHNNHTPAAGVGSVTLQLEQRLSEKQKARRLREEKERLEKEQDKLHRQKTRAQIRADKHVRLHDENWKPTVSAAADKSGTGLQTFRDRHGE